MPLSRPSIILASITLTLATLFASQSRGQEAGFKIGTCDWSIKMPTSADSFQFGQRNELKGIQHSFGNNPERMDVAISKLKRFAPLAEKHGFILGLETLLHKIPTS